MIGINRNRRRDNFYNKSPLGWICVHLYLSYPGLCVPRTMITITKPGLCWTALSVINCRYNYSMKFSHTDVMRPGRENSLTCDNLSSASYSLFTPARYGIISRAPRSDIISQTLCFIRRYKVTTAIWIKILISGKY